ncbi:dCTP deaminase [Buchnera aphidicola (Tetraneura ulmi)]|uniref:dCTP deaminase n=1 Tax=Buchnera aphidicola TaxID=9 RepID=UPI003463ABFD
MRLSDKDIEIWLNKGLLQVIPTPKKKFINGATIDLRLGNQFRVFKDYSLPFIDLSGSSNKINNYKNRIMSSEIILSNKDFFYLQPGSLSLGITKEEIIIPNNLIGWLDGRSSLARLGLMIHATAHRIDPGWKGKIVLEFFNCGKVTLALKPGMLIGAISFEILSSISVRPYDVRSSAKYFNQLNIISSQID